MGPRPTDGRQGYLCPSGASCPLGTPLEVPCEPGSFSPAPGLARCLTCLAGTVCGSPGTQLPTPCPAGDPCPWICFFLLLMFLNYTYMQQVALWFRSETYNVSRKYLLPARGWTQ